MSPEEIVIREAREVVASKIPGFPVSTLSDHEVRNLMNGLWVGGWSEFVADYQRIQREVVGHSTAPSIHKQVRTLKDIVHDYRFRWTLRVHEEWLQVKIEADQCVLVRRVANAKEGTFLDRIKFGTEVTIWTMVDETWERTYSAVVSDAQESLYRKAGTARTIEVCAEDLINRLLK